jgi:hypothetical protein
VSMTIEFDGLKELIEQLTRAPEAIRQEGMEIVRDEATSAATEAALRYPTRADTIARRIRVEFPSSQILYALVKSAAPHSHLYEFGTKEKRKTSKGWNRGIMPGLNPQIIVPVMERHRLQMYERLKDMLRRMGYVLISG